MKSKLGLLLIVAGIGILLTPQIMRIQGAYSQRALENQWNQAQVPPAAKKPNPKQPEKSTPKALPLTQLVIPAIGLKAVIVEGTTLPALAKGPGHFTETALPGQPGNCCIAAHRNMYGSWFRDLDKMTPGDQIILKQRDTQFVYQVTEQTAVPPTDLSVLDQTEDAVLTLITCTPVPHPTKRLIIKAQLVRPN